MATIAQPRDLFGLRKKTQALPVIGNVQATNPASAVVVGAGLVTVAGGAFVADRIAERSQREKEAALATTRNPVTTTPALPTSARRSYDPEVERYLRTTKQPTPAPVARDTYAPVAPPLPATATATPQVNIGGQRVDYDTRPFNPFKPSDNLTRDEKKSLDAWGEPGGGAPGQSPPTKPWVKPVVAAGAGAGIGYLLTDPFDLGGNPPAGPPGPGDPGTPDGSGPDPDTTGNGDGNGDGGFDFNKALEDLAETLGGRQVVPDTPIQNPADRAVSLIFAPLGGLGEGIADIGTGTGYGLGAIGGGFGGAVESIGEGIAEVPKGFINSPAVPIILAVGGLLLFAAKDPGIRSDLASARRRHRAKKEKSPIKKAPHRHPGVPGA